MSPIGTRPALLLASLALVALAACRDDAPPLGPATPAKPQFTQGDAGLWTVTTTDDPGDGLCTDTDCTLREAVEAAQNGGKIVFETGVSGTIALAGGPIRIEKDIQVDGDGRIAIDAQGTDVAVRAFAAHAEMSGMTITGGGTSGLWVQDFAGLTLRSVTVTGNTSAYEGGGIFGLNGSLTLINSSVSGNHSDRAGGGIYLTGALTVVNSTIADNEAVGRGGGIYFEGGFAAITGSTISGNSAVNAGGLWTKNALTTIRSSTLVKNIANGQFAVGGLEVETDGPLSAATIANTIIAGNSGDGTEANCGLFNSGAAASIRSLGHNLTPGCGTAAAGDVIVNPAQVFTEVLESGLKDNGGPTKTHALLERGRAVDAGYCPGETADQRGLARPVDDNRMPNAVDGCDIGAFEWQPATSSVRADLLVSQAVNKTSVKQGDLLTYYVRVQNLGPSSAANVVLNDILSSGVTFVSARGNRGTFTAPPQGQTGTVTWYLGDLANQGSEVAELAVTVIAKGKSTITNAASAISDVADPNPANNSAAITVSVAAGSAGKSPRK
jgi:uncharacterized repeat protein (TIGR01451 family)/CSLREA domain-containing protein